MARKRYKPEEIVGKLRQAEVLHSHGIGMAETILLAEEYASLATEILALRRMVPWRAWPFRSRPRKSFRKRCQNFRYRAGRSPRREGGWGAW